MRTYNRICAECGNPFETQHKNYFMCPLCYALKFHNGIELKQCKGITVTGERCKIIVRSEDGYCTKHKQPIAVNANNWLMSLLEPAESERQ